MTDMETTAAQDKEGKNAGRAAVLSFFTSLRWAWLTGPIFDKEMRVSSRRRRNYVLRFLYIGLFTFMAAVLWMDRVTQTATSGYTPVYQVSRMASAGQQIITAVLWFQFFAAQIACHRHAQHVDQRRDLQADARRAHDDADRELSDRDRQADEQAAANRAAAGDLAAAAGGRARVRRRPLGLSLVRLVRDADDGCLRRVPEPAVLDLHPPGVRGDSRSHPGDRFSVRVHSADPGPLDLPQGPFGPHDQGALLHQSVCDDERGDRIALFGAGGDQCVAGRCTVP